MQSSSFALRIFTKATFSIVACAVALAGVGLAQPVRAQTFEITAFSIDKIDALGRYAEDVRSFGVSFSSPAASVSLGIWKKGSPNILFYGHEYQGPVSSLYISPGDWTGKLEPDTTYIYTLTARAVSDLTQGVITAGRSGEFTTAHYVPAKPDFIVERLEFPEHPQVNEEITIHAYFKNIGGPSSHQGFVSWIIDPLFNTGNFAISSSEDEYVQQNRQSWPTGGVDHVQLHGHFVRSGQFNLRATEDNGNNIDELSEANNSLSAYVFVQPQLNWQLIKTSSSPAVYWYSKNTRSRHPYVDEASYRSWFFNFNNITSLSAADMATIPLGSIVRVKPGTRMVKITTDPKVYAVDVTGTLRWVQTEEIARQLYGYDWNKKVIDLDVSLFAKYNFGSDITVASDFNVTDVMARSTSIDSVLY